VRRPVGLSESRSQGLPKDELFVYQAALRERRTVLIVLEEDKEMAAPAHEALMATGAESVDAARRR